MALIERLLNSIPDGKIETVVVGLNWTAVCIQVNSQRLCGLSSTVKQPHQHGKSFDVPEAGKLTSLSARQLAEYTLSEQATLSSIGTAALNALLQINQMQYVEKNAEAIISEFGAGKHVAIIGHFPFTERIKNISSHLDVLEKNPAPGDIPASQASKILPNAHVVAITGMTFVNHTLEPLLKLCAPDSKTIVLGASTPLSPIMFEYGIDFLCGALTINIDAVLRTVAEGAVFPQIARAGLKLVTIQNS